MDSTLYYAARHKDKNVVEQSRSGGVFTVLSDFVLDKGGVIYGCKFDYDNTVVFSRATTKIERDCFRGSKYVQATIGNSFEQVEKDLQERKLVLFSGTACQVAGLLAVLNKKHISTETLVTLDVLCHGVPSPLLYQMYLDYCSKRLGQAVDRVVFRDKDRYGWGADVMSVYAGKRRYSSSDMFVFFGGGLSERISCRHCKFHKLDRSSFDFTIGDFWGVEKWIKEFSDDKGTSSVFCNTEKAKNIFQEIKKDLLLKEVDVDQIMQPVLKGNMAIPSMRDAFWSDVKQSRSFADFSKKYRTRNYYIQMIKHELKALFLKIKKNNG